MNEELYFACMSFCEVFTKYLCERNRLHRREMCFDEMLVDESKRRVEVYEDILISKYDRLCEVINKIEENNK